MTDTDIIEAALTRRVKTKPGYLVKQPGYTIRWIEPGTPTQPTDSEHAARSRFAVPTLSRVWPS